MCIYVCIESFVYTYIEFELMPISSQIARCLVCVNMNGSHSSDIESRVSQHLVSLLKVGTTYSYINIIKTPIKGHPVKDGCITDSSNR